MVVIRMGRKRSKHAWKIASREFFPSVRSACNAKSIIKIAFFLTIPIKRMMPMSAMTLRSVRKSISARTAPTPADGRVDKMVIGWIRLS